MATYTKETALYDTGKIGNDIASAGQTATSYLTTISGTSGISVHNANDEDNFVNMNSEGVGIYQDGINVAQFGATTRIGTSEDASITINDSSIVGRGAGGKEFFTFSDSTGDMSTQYASTYASKVKYADFPHTSATGLSGDLQYSPTANTAVTVFFEYRNYNTLLALFPLEFTAGQNQETKSNTNSVTINGTTYSVTAYITYNGDKTFSNIYVTSSPNNPNMSIAVTANYYVVATAPSYELGSGNATGGYSFIEGFGTEASGNYSHAGGNGTKASGESQVVFGKFNVEDTNDNFALIIGNGRGHGGSNDRHNAFTVDWDGNVNISCPGTAVTPKYKINGTALSPTDLGETDYVTSNGTSGTWTYRKWKSGKIEAWSGYSFSSAASTVWTSPIRYWDKTINIPSGIFSAAPRIMVSAQSNQYWIGGASASSATAATARVLTVATSSMAVNLNIYAIQG